LAAVLTLRLAHKRVMSRDETRPQVREAIGVGQIEADARYAGYSQNRDAASGITVALLAKSDSA
jgi:hypothetical protein